MVTAALVALVAFSILLSFRFLALKKELARFRADTIAWSQATDRRLETLSPKPPLKGARRIRR